MYGLFENGLQSLILEMVKIIALKKLYLPNAIRPYSEHDG